MPATTPVWIGLGSNLGDRRAILDAALAALARTEGVAVSRVSTYRETLPVGGPAGQGPFLNAAVRLDTTLTPRGLLAATQRIEAELGRVRVVRWGERTLDIDLLIFGSKFVDESDLKLPHPRLALRRFVLAPLAEIAPDVVDTITRRTVADLLANLDRRPRIVMVDDAGPLGTRWTDRLALALSGIRLPSPVADQTDRGERLRGRLVALRTEVERGRTGPADWLVCDFVVDVPRERELNGRLPNELTPEMLAERVSSLVDVHGEGMRPRFERDARRLLLIRELELGLAAVPDPTLIISLAGGPIPRRPGIVRSPVYWPEATEPEAIVAEVAAVCRGIGASE